jgi:hypothetical protein
MKGGDYALFHQFSFDIEGKESLFCGIENVKDGLKMS